MPTAEARTFPFDRRTDALLASLRESGQYKVLQTLEGPMDAEVEVRGYGRCLCFCSNNYLGLAHHPEVNAAAIDGVRRFGSGTASVRFICGTFSPHETLERAIADLMGLEAACSFVSCWNANEALFPTLCEDGDIVISDELNHASIIDSIRLMGTIRKGALRGVYRHNDLADLRARLQAARDNPAVTGQVWVVTDGVFSMEGDLADLPGLRRLCDEFEAILVVDDSHGTGVMGQTGRGTHEHYQMAGAAAGRIGGGGVDIITGTLGKALGGAAGGFVAGSRRVVDLLVQRARPALFSNAIPVPVACAAAKAIEVLWREPALVARLRDNAAYARARIAAAGFSVIDSPTAICPIIVHDTAKAIAMSRRLLELGVFVIGFGYPVVPEGHARLRVQVSAAHTREHIDRLVDALRRL
jgi:glycine C-acetyltransferase